MKSIDYYVDKLKSSIKYKEYTDEEIKYAANYYYNLFDELSRMYIIENNGKRELTEIEKFLFIYITIASKVKDHDQNDTSRDIIGTIITNKAICQGYSTIMQFICNELSIPFLYKNTSGDFGPHGNFQVIVKDKDNVEHCLHCDAFIDAPNEETDTLTYNATLISANDMNNYHNPQTPASELLFWNIVDGMSLEEKKKSLDSLSFLEEIRLEEFKNEKFEVVIEGHYESLKDQIISLNNFFHCEIGSLETREDILRAYQIMKDYYDKTNIAIDRDELYNMIKQIYISYNVSILNMDIKEAIKSAEEIVNKQIENTQIKHKDNWIK